MAPRRLSSLWCAAVTAAVALLLFLITDEAVAVTYGPITAAQCYILNPSAVPVCTDYTAPAVDVYANLPYSSVDAYASCVKERCVCTGSQPSIDFAPDGRYCNSSGWLESGYTSCNVMIGCFRTYWQCLNDALMDRYNADVSQLDAGEKQLAADIVAHGKTAGDSFASTDTYRSCRSEMCLAASSRGNCGLRTCQPNYTQCNEYIKPPPQPYDHQICTPGCQAVLVLMALTIALVSFSMCCCICCPTRVKSIEPLLVGNGEPEKQGSKRSSSDAEDVE